MQYTNSPPGFKALAARERICFWSLLVGRHLENFDMHQFRMPAKDPRAGAGSISKMASNGLSLKFCRWDKASAQMIFSGCSWRRVMFSRRVFRRCCELSKEVTTAPRLNSWAVLPPGGCAEVKNAFAGRFSKLLTASEAA